MLLSVADQGLGIPESERERIFEPFYRGSEAIAAQVRGNGLGLSLVRRIAAAHGGRSRSERPRARKPLHAPAAAARGRAQLRA